MLKHGVNRRRLDGELAPSLRYRHQLGKLVTSHKLSHLLFISSDGLLEV